MPDDFQPGLHLSPDQLSAFAENVLPEHERRVALTHLGDCPDCRQAVFLAQQADPSLSVAPAIETPRRSWLSLPQFLIAASAALACTLILALVIHHQLGQTTAPVTTAKLDTPPPIAPPAPSATPTPATTNSAATPSPAAAAQLSAAAAHSSAESRSSASPLPQPLPKAAPHPILTPPSSSLGASYHGNISERLRSTRSADSEMKAKSYFDVGSSGSGAPYAIPPKTPGSIDGAARPNTSNTAANLGRSQTAMAADKQQDDALASTADSAVPIAGANSINVNGADVNGLPPAARAATPMSAPMLMPAPPAPPPIHLPSNKPVASRLYAGNRTLALDTAGALFITYDSGRHWIAVAAQWPGKAAQLSFAASPARLYQVQPQQSQTQSESSVTTGAAASGLAQQSQQTIAPTAGFQLTTSTGAVWLSTDGLTWHAR